MHIIIKNRSNIYKNKLLIRAEVQVPLSGLNAGWVWEYNMVGLWMASQYHQFSTV